jgi:hypothetical protein
MPVDENRLRAERLYESKEPIVGLAADLDQIQSIAAGWRTSRKQLALWSTVAWVVGVISFAVGLWYAGLLLFALAGWLLHWMKRYPKTVAKGRDRAAFGKSIAAMLRPDADPKAPVAMRLAFDPTEETISESALPNRKNGRQRLYKVSWFSVEASLHDGTKFGQTVVDFVRHRSFTNPRGKSKTKTRTQSLIAMRFDYPAQTYGDLTRFREKMEKEIQLPEGTAMRGLEVSGRSVKVKALITKTADPANLAQASSMLALGIYRMFNLSREVEARKRAQAKKGGPQ